MACSKYSKTHAWPAKATLYPLHLHVLSGGLLALCVANTAPPTAATGWLVKPAVRDPCPIHATQVEPLIVRIMIVGCARGEVVDWLHAEPICRACPSTAYSLWEDKRNATAGTAAAHPAPAASSPQGPGASSSTAGDGNCRTCPTNAVCPGGASVLPRLGYWHSSPTSIQMHKCVHADACLGPAVLRVDGEAVVADGRVSRVNAALYACQQAWYASRPAGVKVAARYSNADNVNTCLLWGAANSSTAQVAEVPTGMWCI